MDKVKIKNIKTGAIEEVKSAVAGDFIGTGEWVMATEETQKEENKPIFNKENK